MTFTVVRTGCTRIVFLTKRYAVKIPALFDCSNSWSWEFFCKGMLANIQERRFWRFGGWPELCPVLFSLPLGLLIVMPRARELSDSEFSQIDFHGFIERDGYRVPVEAKSNSFGWLKGRLVAIDYGN